jgi:hypothetical protein
VTRKRPPENAWATATGELDHAAEATRRLTPPQVADGPGDPARPTALVSTAAAYRIGDPPNGRLIRPRQHEGWEPEVWQMYDCTGELHYVAAQYGRAVSRARFYIAEYDDEGIPRESKNPEARAYGRDLLGGEATAGNLVYLSSVQQFMSGQSLITAHDSHGWEAYSDQDFNTTPTGLSRTREGGPSPYKVDDGNGRQVALSQGTLTIHMWDRHPARASRVDSSVRPALPYLRELARLDQYVQSLLLSRIALAGILQVPHGAEVATPVGMDAPPGMDPLMHVLALVGTTNIQDPGTAAAILPVLLKMPLDQKLELLTLDQPLTGEINAFREINLKRLAMSLDLAPEAMSGFSDVKYSNAEWIQDESVQTHIKRRVGAFNAAFTIGYARPALGDRYLVQADVSELEKDVDNSDFAIALFDRGELDGDGLRQAGGMRDASPPEGPELLRQLAVRAITSNPSLFPALAPLLGLREAITLTPEQSRALEQAGPGDSGLEPAPIPDAAPPTPTTPTNTPEAVRGPQPLPSAARPVVSEALVSACDVLVCAALGSAGSRWRKARRHRATECRALETQALYLVKPVTSDHSPDQSPREHAAALIADRWAAVPRVAALHAANPDCLGSALADYVAGLLVDQRPHHPDQLRHVVAGCVA